MLGIDMFPSQRIAFHRLAIVLVAHLALLAASASLRQEQPGPPAPLQMIDVVVAEPLPQVPQMRRPLAPPAREARAADRWQPAERAATATPVVTTPDAAVNDMPTHEPTDVLTRPQPVEQATALTAQGQSSQSVAALDPTTEASTPARVDADYLANPRPTYPPLSRRAGEQGRVVLRVHVDATGVPTTVQVQMTSGFERLDKVATATVKRWRFIPGRQGSTPVPTWVDVPITFSLEDTRS